MQIIPKPRGWLQTFSIDTRTGLWLPRSEQPNEIMYSWAYIACQALGRGNPVYRINAFYVEFENVAAPNDVVAVPSFEREDGLDYYQTLSGTRDYLRIPLLDEPRIAIAPGYEEFFTEGVDGNMMTFRGQTSGTAGVNGLQFDASVNSKIYGLALVATPVFADRTRDILFGRSYYATDRQFLKEDGYQAGFSWSQTFG